MNKLLRATLIAAMALTPAAAPASETIEIVGSSTVYPFATIVAERFSQITEFKAPKIESTGSGGGMKLFCQGVGAQTPDVTNSSRRMKQSEQQLCDANGVADVIEVKIGYDGIVIAQSREGAPMSLTRRDLFLALAKQTPDAGGNLIANPRQTWQDVNPALPPVAIQVYGPPPTSGTRDAFAELVMEAGCDAFASIRAIADKKKHQAVCHAAREDGAYIESGENDNLIVQKLAASPNALGIFGYSFLEENQDKVRSAPIDNVAATFDAIADGSYPVSRPLYFYAKAAHYDKVDGLAEFVDFFVSDDVMGEYGLLTDIGLIPLPPDEYEKTVADALARANMPRL